MISEIELEKFLQDVIFPDLEKGRPGWDKPHTESVVQYLKHIIDNSPKFKVDRQVLIIAAYAHDWGYAGLFKDGRPLQLEDVSAAKKLHMKLGAEKLEKLLQDKFFNFLTKEQKARAVHLVSVHDNKGILKDDDELILLEADTLGGLDTSRVKPTYSKDSNRKFMIGVMEARFPKFITDYGKREFKKVYQLREAYYNDLG